MEFNVKTILPLSSKDFPREGVKKLLIIQLPIVLYRRAVSILVLKFRFPL
jgi:hypothetical protein